MNTISVQELKEKIDNKEKIQLIDLRENHEFEDFNIGGINIPLDNFFSSLDKVEKEIPVIIYCNSGRRSAAVLYSLKVKANLANNLYSLKGGIKSYIAEFIQ